MIPHITNEIKDAIRAVVARRRRRARRDRRHGRRHREPAVPRSDPPVPPGRRPRQLALHPPDAGAVHRRRRRAEDQADAAQRPRPAVDRHPARHPALPHRSVPRRRPQAEDRAVLRRRRGSGHHREGRRRRSTKCRWCSPPKGSIASCSSTCTCRRPSAACTPWEELVERIKNPLDEITIHVVGKYVGYEDSYKSLNEALYHGGFAHRREGQHQVGRGRGARGSRTATALLDGADGILVPGGFGDRGTRGMMKAAQIARERGIPYFGICYGFQWATVEYARNVAGLTDADSTECAPDTPTQGDLQAARPARRRRPRRHDAARAATPASSTPGSLGAARSTARPRFTSATATATSSTASTSRRSPTTACGSRAARPTASSSRSPSCRAIPGTSRCSSIRSSSRSRRRPHPLFAGFVEARVPAQDGQRAARRRPSRCA